MLSSSRPCKYILCVRWRAYEVELGWKVLRRLVFTICLLRSYPMCLLCQCASVSFRVSCFILFFFLFLFHLFHLWPKKVAWCFSTAQFPTFCGWVACRSWPQSGRLLLCWSLFHSFLLLRTAVGWSAWMHTPGQPPDVPYVGYVLVLSMMPHAFSSCIWSWSLEAREADWKTPCIRPGGSRHLWEATGIQKLEYRQPVIRSWTRNNKDHIYLTYHYSGHVEEKAEYYRNN